MKHVALAAGAALYALGLVFLIQYWRDTVNHLLHRNDR